MSLPALKIAEPLTPLDVFEQVLTTYDFDYVRTDEDDLILSVLGQCASYHLHLSWQHEYDALQIVCGFPGNIVLPPPQALARLCMMANTQLWCGHFELSADHVMQFRYTTMLPPETPGQGIDTMNDLFKLAVAECDRFYPALLVLAENPDAPDDVIAFALQDPLGQG